MTYYFNNINFNSSYFSSSSSSASSSTITGLNNIFINKKIGSSPTGNKYFTTNQTFFNDSLNLVSKANNITQINFYDPSPIYVIINGVLTAITQSVISSTLDDLSFNCQALTNGLSIYKNNTLQYYLNNSIINIPSFGYNYNSLPTYTINNIGFNYGSTTTSYTGNKSVIGTYYAYSSTNSVALPIGVYLITVNAVLSGVGNPSNYLVSQFQAGYTLGQSITPASNIATPLMSNGNYSFNTNLQYEQNLSSVVNVTQDNSYLSAYSKIIISIVSASGAIQSGIASYFVVRIA